jgi:hydrogenase/urease accessory protein HupE
MTTRRSRRGNGPSRADEAHGQRSLRTWLALVVLGLTVLLWPAGTVRAHEYRPAVLVISAEAAEGSAPSTDAQLRFTPGTGDAEHVQFDFDAGCEVRLDRLRCEEDADLRVFLLDPYGEQELVVEVVDHDGSRATVVLTAEHPRARLGTLSSASAVLEVADAGSPHTRWSSHPFVHWLVTGVEHVWTGLDHLAFIIGLWLVAPSMRARAYAATAFTVGHSATLALAVLGGVSLPSGSVEACIALSVVLLAREALEAGSPKTSSALQHTGYGERAPPLALWGVGFGLLHGLGFAGALQASGLGTEGRAVGLLAFNLGVELGQLVVLLTCSAIAVVAVTLLGASSSLQEHSRRTVAWTLGSVAGMWYLERAWAVVTLGTAVN